MFLGKEKRKDILKVRSSRKIYFPLYFMIFVLVSTIVYLKYHGAEISTFALILAGVFIIVAIKYSEVHRLSNLYEITPVAVIHYSGILNRRVKNTDIASISDVGIKQNFWQRLFGFGDVLVHLFGEVRIIRNINNPTMFSNFIEKMMYEKRNRFNA